MKRYPTQNIIRRGLPILCLWGLPQNGIVANAQETQSGAAQGFGSPIIVTGGVFTAAAPNGAVAGKMWRNAQGGSNACFAVQIGNSFFSDLGVALLKACDLNHDGKVTLPELKAAASACFKLWDTNASGGLDQAALLNGIKDLLPM